MSTNLEIESRQETKQLTPEYLKSLSTLEVEVHGNFEETLNNFNTDRGLNLQSRPEGQHVTIIGPTESKILPTLTPEQIEALQRINDDIQNGIGTEMMGLGFIDGSQREDIRKADKEKKVLYAALNLPALQEFRKSLGLPPKDFHTTLGFEGGDIHMHTAGKDAKGKDILEPISKTADSTLNGYAEQLQNVQFGGLSGKERDKPKN
ncbi:MAG: hypothetical protein NTV36_02815 [Candidatus Staskawiczbacteria bacterium]|nr:hypothetical protein [Candidatus Staskawiczbacteria bacterium]